MFYAPEDLGQKEGGEINGTIGGHTPKQGDILCHQAEKLLGIETGNYGEGSFRNRKINDAAFKSDSELPSNRQYLYQPDAEHRELKQDWTEYIGHSQENLDYIFLELMPTESDTNTHNIQNDSYELHATTLKDRFHEDGGTVKQIDEKRSETRLRATYVDSEEGYCATRLTPRAGELQDLWRESQSFCFRAIDSLAGEYASRLSEKLKSEFPYVIETTFVESDRTDFQNLNTHLEEIHNRLDNEENNGHAIARRTGEKPPSELRKMIEAFDKVES